MLLLASRNSKKNQYQIMRINIFRLISITIIYFLILSCSKGQSNDNEITSQVDSLLALPKSIQSYNFAQELIKRVEKTQNDDLNVEVMKWLGNYYRLNKQFEKSLEIFFQLNKIGETKNDSTLLCFSLMKLGSTYSVLDNSKKALFYLDEAMKIAKKNKDIYYQGFVLNEYGYLYMNQGNYDKAIKYWIEAKEIMQSLGEIRNGYAANANIGIAYTLIGKPKEGLKTFFELYRYNQTNKDSVYFAENCGNIAFAYQKMGVIDSALMYYDSSFYFAEIFHQYKTASISYNDLSEFYIDIGDYKKALNAFKKYHEYEKKAVGEATQQRIADLEVAYDMERQKRELVNADSEIKELKYKDKIRLQRIFIIISGLILILILVIVYYYRLKGKLKFKKIEEQLVKTKLRNKHLETEALKKKIEYKNNDLASFSLDIGHKNLFLSELIGQLEELKSQIPAIYQKNIQKIINYCNSNLKSTEILSLKQKDIDKINQEFFSRLESRFGTMTKNEKLLVASFRLGLSNKDIANKKGISINSVKMGRYRLRKKLKLSKNIDLIDFLQSF